MLRGSIDAKAKKYQEFRGALLEQKIDIIIV